jgi:hypothetical protein
MMAGLRRAGRGLLPARHSGGFQQRNKPESSVSWGVAKALDPGFRRDDDKVYSRCCKAWNPACAGMIAEFGKRRGVVANLSLETS